MTRADIVQEMCGKANLSKKEADEMLLLLFKALKDNMMKGHTIYFRGFGTFGTKTRKQRVARNLKTNEKLIVPEHKIPYFQPGKDLKRIKGITASKN